MPAASPPIALALALGLSAALAVGGCAVPAPDTSPVPGTPTLAPMLREVTPGVVNVAVTGRAQALNPLLNDPFFRRFFDLPDLPQPQRPPQPPRRTFSSGSGVIVDAGRGYVLTNSHVVAEAESIEVTTKDNRRFEARLVGRDHGTDIAVLRIVPGDGTQGGSQGGSLGDLQAVPFGDSGALEVGDYVVAIGNPFGLGQTVTSGIVSALGRGGLRVEGYEDFIQTDASINPGNSGGALVDLQGRLVGINTAILAPSGGNVGIGFAVPANMARTVMDQIIRYGEVRRGRIGISVQDLTPDIAAALGTRSTSGAIVAEVEPGSPADRAGLRRGDVVIAIDGAEVRSATQVRNHVGLKRVGESVTLTVERNGARDTLSARIEEEPKPGGG
ncbi:trypsin-like peptidase domain-containing protein [Skermanella rosea]|uniref:trypsin-like peptidase domain-containing protein n=1 Tax=Skermanella rosea TaxID=1817965 RepID=UPI001933F7AC|nr:trypsin-like peptidase domain-containing protein [Skermanella rosea]UEM01775.1 trypsin-like peptidase domain-containing protein [Skermanella rosea]